MSRLIRHRPSPAMVVALLALFIAMAGTSYAAIKLPADSVGAKQIKANAVVSSKIKADAVVSSKIKNGSLSVKDFGVGQIPAGPAGPQGASGPQGPAGPQGARGPDGAPAVTVIDVRDSGAPAVSPVETLCPSGEIATGGGGVTSGGNLTESRPVKDVDGFPVGWHVAATTTVTAWVVCVG